MKKIYFSLFFSAILSFVFSTSFSQTITLGSLVTTSFCPSGALAVPFTSTLPAGIQYNVYLSNSSGSFTSQRLIGTGTASPINITFPSSTASGTGYLIKIVSVSPVSTSNFSSALSTNGQKMNILIKNLDGKSLNENSYSVCSISALTGVITSNQTGGTFQWKQDGNLQTTNDTYRMIKPQSSASSTYSATIQKVGCTTISKSFTITYASTIYYNVNMLGVENQCSGSSVIIKTNYISDSANFQWKKDNILLSGEIRDTIIANQTGRYTVDIIDKCPIIENEKVNVGKRVIFSNSIENTIDPLNVNNFTLCGNITYGGFNSSVVNYVKNPLAPYTYQWKKNGVNIINETKSYLYYIRDTDVYSLALTQGNCTSISDGKSYTRADTIRLKLTLRYPNENEICSGMQSYLETNTISGVNTTIYKDGIPFLSNPAYGFSVTQTGKYTVGGVTSGCVVLPSDTVKITVANKIEPKIFTYGNIFCNGSSSYIRAWSSLFASLPNITRQWFRNNQAIVGAISEQVNVSQSGFYKLKVTSNNCIGYSDSIEIKTVVALPKPKISNSLNTTILCSNTFLPLGIKDKYLNEVSDEVSYDSLYWKKDGQIVGRVRKFENFYASQSGIYTVAGKQGTCTSPESDPVEIKIGEPITANITGSTSIYPGQKAKLDLNFTGGNAWSYQTSDVATGQTTSLSPTVKNVSPTSTQTYSITSVASNCGVGTVTGNATVTVLPCPIVQTISLQSGNWNLPATWSCGQIPSATLDAIIENGHTVTLPNGYQGVTKTLNLKGGLAQGVGAGVSVNK